MYPWSLIRLCALFSFEYIDLLFFIFIFIWVLIYLFFLAFFLPKTVSEAPVFDGAPLRLASLAESGKAHSL